MQNLKGCLEEGKHSSRENFIVLHFLQFSTAKTINKDLLICYSMPRDTKSDTRLLQEGFNL